MSLPSQFPEALFVHLWELFPLSLFCLGISKGCVVVPMCEQTRKLELHLSSDSLGVIHLVFETGSLTLASERPALNP